MKTITNSRSATINKQQCWIRPSTSPPPLPHIPYGLHPPSPPPSSLSDDGQPTAPLSSITSPPLQGASIPTSSVPIQQALSPIALRPKSWNRHQLTQTQLLEMDEDDVLMEQDKIDTSSWCSLDLSLSDPISIPSDSQENLDRPDPLPETIMSKSTLAAREINKINRSTSAKLSQSDSSAIISTSVPKSSSSAKDPGPAVTNSERPPPTPVIVTPPSSPADITPPLTRIPSLVFSECAPSESQPYSASLSVEESSRRSNTETKTKRRCSQKSTSSNAQKRARPSIRSGLLFESITFLLTGFSGSALVEERAELVETIKSLGGHVTQSDSVSESVNLQDEDDVLIRVVIVKDIRKETWTTKIFYTLMRGVPAVDMRWIEECHRQKRIVPLQPFAGSYSDTFLRSNAHYPKERKHRPLFGRRIAYFGINKDEFISIIHAGGGIALRQQGKADLIILGDKDLQSSVVKNRIIQAKHAQIPVVNLQWLKEAATTQSFPNIQQSPHRLDINI